MYFSFNDNTAWRTILDVKTSRLDTARIAKVKQILVLELKPLSRAFRSRITERNL
jgi:hypothetical protein